MASVKEWAFDRVHDTQAVYRQLLAALSRPGELGSIAASAERMQEQLPDSRAAACAAALAYTLLDGEVRFAVRSAELEQSGWPAFVRSRTFSRSAELAEAEFIFTEGMLPAAELERLVKEAQKGTLLRPEAGATLFVQVDALGRGESALSVCGPGVPGERTIPLSGFSSSWIAARAEANAEFPTGLDMVLYTADGLLLGLPRTTRIKEVAAWPM